MTSHECHGVSYQRQFSCLCKWLFSLMTKKNLTPCYWPFARAIYQLFPSQGASNAESVCMSWCQNDSDKWRQIYVYVIVTHIGFRDWSWYHSLFNVTNAIQLKWSKSQKTVLCLYTALFGILQWWITTHEKLITNEYMLHIFKVIRFEQFRTIEHTLTHCGHVIHVCVSKLTIISSDNGLSPGRRQAIIWTNAGILLIGNLGTNFSEILSKINTFSFKKKCVWNYFLWNGVNFASTLMC